MPQITVATDFSTRSDRALRRAELLAKITGHDLLFVNVIDDDQPQRLIDVQQNEIEDILSEMVETICSVSGIRSTYAVRIGQTFREIPAAAEEADADLVVMGPHRPKVMRDAFRGSTIERTVRQCSLPIIVANGVPSAHFKRVMIASDLDHSSAANIRVVAAMPFLAGAEFLLFHVYESMERAADAMAFSVTEDGSGRLAEEHTEMQMKASRFKQEESLPVDKCITRDATGPIAQMVLETARTEAADLVVVAPRKKGMVEALMTGHVGTGILREADRDVLVLPGQELA